MRIVHVLDHSIPLQSGYAFRTLAILREQRALGWDTVHLTSPKHTRPYEPEEEVDGWRFYRTPPVSGLSAALPAVRHAALMRATRRRLDEVVGITRPDVIHAHSPVLNALPALRVGRHRSVPVVYEVRAFWEDAAASHGTGRAGGPRYRISRRMETRALRRAGAVTTICEGLRRDIAARGVPEERITVIPNAVDVERFKAGGDRDHDLAGELGLEGKTVLGFLGSFYGYEGLDVLLTAFPAVLEGAPDARLLLVGGGPEADALRALATELKVTERVVFMGRVPHDEILAYYSLVDLLVFPRLSIRLTETVTPLKPLEAMAQGKVVAASDVGGHRELIRDGETGRLFKAGDPEALAATVLDLLTHRDTWAGLRERGRRFVEEERTWTLSVARYREVYERVLSTSENSSS